MELRQSILPATLELRADGRELSGSFSYSARASVRGRRERFMPGSLRQAETVYLLAAHDLDRPLADTRGSLRFEDTEAALTFTATLPPDAEQPTYMRDALLQVRAGLLGGISPGFRVAPGGEEMRADERIIRAATLFEISLVTLPAYDQTSVAVRDGQDAGRVRFWL